MKNLVAVTAALDQAVTEIVDFISGKCISDL
jgi:5'-methylthioadenosine nucleosidase